MDRRTFSKLLAGTIAAASMPAPLLAKAPVGDQQAFMAALAEKPWLLGYLGASATELHGSVNVTSGRVPDGLRGHLFRNGPALHNIGSDRFQHWFDAPGMVQRFSFSENGVSHHGRLIETARNKAEAKDGRIEFRGFGTHGHNLSSGGTADGQNTANISLIEHAGELLALWEGGSPHIIDPETLDTEGRKAWSQQTNGLPFGAHPRLDRDGSMWNVGYSVNPSVLILYHVSAAGEMLQTHILPQPATPMIHDFLLTDTKIVLVLPPYRATQMGDDAFIGLFEWQESAATQILVIDKDDLSKVTTIEADPFWVFHFGNAYDLSTTEIGFDFALHDDPGFMTQDAFEVMDGSWNGGAATPSRYVEGRLDLSARTLRLQKADALGQVEFIQTDVRDNLGAHRYSLMLAQPGGAEAFGFDRLLLVDRQTGQASHFDVGETEILEEHLIVPKPGQAGDFWIIGTSLDWRTARTSLSVFEGLHLSDGPILRAELDIALPLGLHGTFIGQAA